MLYFSIVNVKEENPLELYDIGQQQFTTNDYAKLIFSQQVLCPTCKKDIMFQ
jgi:hypothetical protein